MALINEQENYSANDADRRQFLIRTGLMLGGNAIANGVAIAKTRPDTSLPLKLDTWEAVRAQFDLHPKLIHLAGFYMASHPKPVREAIANYRRALDENPFGYLSQNGVQREAAVLQAAANYLGARPIDIALTDSTTMGLGLLYGGLKLREGQEILTTTHDHAATFMSLRFRAERTGASLRSIPLYENLATVSEAEIVERLVKALRAETRIVAVTWVHSGTGLKLPLRLMADALAEVNKQRSPADHVIFCVDGVHGIGAEDVTLPELGCDFFVAGGHKWLCGPRGTGFVWGKATAWPLATPIILSFNRRAWQAYRKEITVEEFPYGGWMTPGGFHSYEHRWAFDQAFVFLQTIGKARVAKQIHTLNRQFKEGVKKMPHVKLHTPMAENLSAGIVCFDVQGMTPEEVQTKLGERSIITTVTPAFYAGHYARVGTSLMTLPGDIEIALREIYNLGKK